ncbi:MAG: pyrimidine utilization protein D [Sphingomonadaceae bacterium]|nr:pyrimidine utilization protein D [Sphingomonadaceae bacterium]
MPHAGGLWYEWHGPEEGEVLILSPGLGGSAAYWAPNLEALAARYRVLLYDHRGTGRSDPALPETVSIESMARDVVALTNALGVKRAHFLGHALGGLIGLELALSENLIDRLVVVNGWKELHPLTARCFDVRLELLRKSGPEAYVKAQPLFLYPPSWLARHEAELEAEAVRQLAHFPPVETVEKRIAAARGWQLWLDLTGAVLVIGTEDDMLVPVHCGEALADALPLARFWPLRSGGHACNVTQPDIFNRLVTLFLES